MGIPARPPAAERTGPAWGDGIAVLLVLLAAGALFFLLLPPQGNLLTAQIVLNGEVRGEYRLDTLHEPLLVSLEEAPWPLTLELSAEGVRVLESACPGQDCVHTGRVSRAGGRILCLPNRLVVSLEGGGVLEDFDAVTGEKFPILPIYLEGGRLCLLSRSA